MSIACGWRGPQMIATRPAGWRIGLLLRPRTAYQGNWSRHHDAKNNTQPPMVVWIGSMGGGNIEVVDVVGNDVRPRQT